MSYLGRAKRKLKREIKKGLNAIRGDKKPQYGDYLEAVSDKTGIGYEKLREMKINSRNVRTVVERSGWRPFEAFKNMLDIAVENDMTFSDIVIKGAWKQYRYDKAEVLVNSGSDINRFDGVLKRKPFLKFYYTRSQREAIKNIREGAITVSDLSAFLQVEFPEDIASIEGDIKDRICFKLASVREGSIFICAASKYISPDTFKRKKPACVITYPEYQEQVESAGTTFIPLKRTGSYVTELAALWEKNFDVKVVGITGSVGKTSTAYMIGNVVESTFKMHKVSGNQNTTWQIADYIMKLKDTDEVFVQEGSGSYNGQMERTSHMLYPDIFVLTNIGTGHIANYDGKQERIMYEKLSLDRHAKKDATGVINWDDPLLKKVVYRHDVLKFAIDDRSADIVAEDIKEADGRIEFDVLEQDGVKTHIVLNTIGVHNVYNALAAFGVGLILGIDRAVIAEALTKYESKGARQNLTEYNGRKLFIDCLSATDESMKTAMETIKSISVEDGRRKIAVLGDVSFMGEKAEEVHRWIGNMASEVGSADEVIFYGPMMKYAMEEYSKTGKECRYTDSQDELVGWLKDDTEPGDLIAIKSGHSMKCLNALDQLYGTDLYVDDKFAVNDPIRDIEGMEYKFIEGYGASLLKADRTAHVVEIPEEVEGMRVTVLYRNVYNGSRLRRIRIGRYVRCIGSRAFRHSRRLKRVNFPRSLEMIGEYAFEGCRSLEKVDLSKGVNTIGDGAFSGCTALKEVILPNNLRTISEDAFDDDTEAVFYVKEGSYAEEFARNMDYSVAYIE